MDTTLYIYTLHHTQNYQQTMHSTIVQIVQIKQMYTYNKLYTYCDIQRHRYIKNRCKYSNKILCKRLHTCPIWILFSLYKNVN